MKKVFIASVVVCLSCLSFTLLAQQVEVEKQIEQAEVQIKEAEKQVKKAKIQQEKAEKMLNQSKSQEIIIRKKGEKDTKITVEIKGDNITINGKPINEFKDSDVTINKKEIRIFDGKRNLAISPGNMEMFFDGPFNGTFLNENSAFLGVTSTLENEDNDEAKQNGAKITDVTNGSAAEKAGLKTGDIITKINDKKIETPSALSEAIGSFKPKDEVTVYYKREGKEKSTKAILGESKAIKITGMGSNNADGNNFSFTLPRTPKMPPMPNMKDFNWNENGNFENFNRMESMFPRQQKLGLKIQDTEEGNGVKVLDTDKDSPAQKAGLLKDDIVTEIGGAKITTTDDAREQLMENADKFSYNIKALRNGKAMSFDIKIPKKLKTANL